MQRRLCFLKREVLSIRCDAPHFWRWWCNDQNDHEGQKPNNETRIPNPQSCTWSLVWQNQPGPKSSNQECWHQETNCRHFNKKAVSRVMSGIIFSVLSKSFSALPAAPKRWRKECNKEQERRKSKPTLNLVSRIAASSSTAPSSSASNRPGEFSEHPVSKVRISQHKVQGNLPLEVQIKMTWRRVLKCG